MHQKLFALSLGFGGLVLAAQHAFAETPTPVAAQCGTRADVVALLADRYGETRHSIGLAANSSVMEVFASDETGTWTITVTMANGTTCLVASGEHFESMTETLPAKGKGA